MLKLVTGLPGAGKTSNELWDFLHNPDYANRPKFATPINGFVPADHGVTAIDHIDKWHELPDGSVIFCDEVQRYCGTDLGREAPQWVQDFAIHRHSGKDLIFLTQAPGFLHPFARKLVQPHVNYHRPYNLNRSMRYTWESVQTDPASKTARNTGQSSMVKVNPEVFKLYTSTVMDTHRPKPPLKSLIILGVAILVAVLCIFFALKFVLHLGSEPEQVQADPVTTAAVVTSAKAPPITGFPLQQTETKPVWTEETMKPRIASQPHTAPVYDQLTAPTDFPRVAGCISSESRGTCNCFTQQATPIDVPPSACLVYVKHGSFDPWLTGRKQHGNQEQMVPELQTKTPPQMAVASNSGFKGVPVTVVAETASVFRNVKDARTGRP